MGTATVGTPSLAWQEMAVRWNLIHDLIGGTMTMRAARTKWLPLEPRESLEQYEVRLLRSFLFNGYKDGVRRVVSKPFSRSVTLRGAESLPEQLQDIEKNADKAGSTLTQFGSACMKDGIHHGVDHILVDFPKTGGVQTAADERTMGLRPFFVHIPAPNLIGWRVDDSVEGPPVLKQIRIKEFRVIPDGEFGEKLAEFVRVINDDGKWALYERNADVKTVDNVQYIQRENGTLTFPGIPLVTWYTERDGFMTGTPAMEELAWTNLAHWQSYSDQRNCLRFARTGILFAKGISEQDIEEQTGQSKLVVGPQSFFRGTSPDADMKYVEHSGAAIESGRQDIKDLEERMERLGLRPLTQRSGDQTATGKAIDEASSASDAQAWVRSLEGALNEAYRIAGRWVKKEVSDDFAVDIFNEWGLGDRSATDLDLLLRAASSGKLSNETFLEECRRRKVLSEFIDIQEELERIEVQGPDLSGMLPEEKKDEDEDEEDEEEKEDEEISEKEEVVNGAA